MIMKGNCGECERRYFCEIDPDKCDEWPDHVPKTNAGRIRAMSDEELAKIIDALVENFEGCNQGFEIDCHDCELCWLCSVGEGKALDWLRQPAEDQL